MANQAKVTVTSRLPEWISDEDKRNDRVILSIATDIQRIAKLNAPVDTGVLIASGRIKRNRGADYTVIFGGGRVKYAKRRHYENNLHPSTRLYLERAGDSVSRNFKRYYETTR